MSKSNRKIILESDEINRKIVRISHEIIEKNINVENLLLVGILSRGVPIAKRIRLNIKKITSKNVNIGSLDITFHRDDFRDRFVVPQVKGTSIDDDINNKILVLVDDVLYTGRTIRAALDELNTFGRPSKIQLAVLVDRGHREVPIKADFIGANIPTHEGEHVKVELEETDKHDHVILISGRGEK
jgi:pyrimidine operon attenuation protein/uracil phosphoribosyltransferase